MSTANKLTYLNDTKQKLKQSINALGGDITDETTFRQYVDQLDGVYDVLPKTEFQEGTEVTIEGGLKGKIDFDEGKVGFGQASQETTQGYQLMNLPTFSQTQKGIKVEYINGVIKISGTASESGWAFYTSHEVASVESGQTYTYSLSSNKTATALQFFLGCEPGAFEREPTFGSFDLSSTNSNRTKVMSASGSLKFMVFGNITSGTTYNLEIKPMLETGSTAHNWEPYTNGASPNPSYPQEIKYVRGKNLFDKVNANILNASISNNVISASNNAKTLYISCEPNETYTISRLAGKRFQVGCTSSIPTISTSVDNLVVDQEASSITITTNSTAQYLVAYFYLNGTDTLTEQQILDSIQIEEGTQATPYLPYNTIQETITANILDYSTLYLHPNNNLRVINNDHELEVTPNTAILIKANAGYNYGYFELDTNKNTLVDSGWKYGTTTFTSNANTKYIRLNLRYADNSTITNVQDFINGMGLEIQYGTEYVTPRTYQFSLGDHKFYGIGTYRDYILRTTGKNLAHIELEGKYREYRYGSIQTNADFNGYIASVKPNTSYIANGNGLVGYPARLSNLCFFDSEMTYIDGNAYTSADKTFTTPNNCYYVTIAVSNYISNFQIEEGSTASDYQPFGVGNWYKVGKINDYKITGNEAISVNTDLTNTSRIAMYTALSDKPSVDVSVKLPLSNYFVGVQNWSADVVGIYTNQNSIVFRVLKTIATTEQEIKMWLSSHSVLVVYVLATPTYTQITGTLAEQLEAWYYAHSNNGTTILESNGDLPMPIKVRALKGES